MRAKQGTDDFLAVPVSRRPGWWLTGAGLTVAWLLCAASCSGSGRSAAAAPSPYTQAEGQQGQPSSSSTSVADSAPRPAPGVPAWISIDSAGRTVTLSLETSEGPTGSSALINGHRAGQARVIIPVAWTVKWSWRNADSAAHHSLVVTTQREKIPVEGGRPAFSNAVTKTPIEGLAAGQTDQSTFQADEAGWYWLLCGVPGHALSGEWIEIRIDPEAKTVGYLEKGPS